MNYTKGFIAPLLLALVALLLIGGGAYVYVQKQANQSEVVNPAAQTSSTVITIDSLATTTVWLESGTKPLLKAAKADKESIQADFGATRYGNAPVDFLYENQNRIYFTPPNTIGEGGCMELSYLDKASLVYYSTSVYGCPAVPFASTSPFYIETISNWEGTNFPLNAVNLDSGRIIEIYKPADNESLLKKYGSPVPSLDVESVDKDRIRIGIYKRYKSFTEMQEDKYGDYFAEKIRDEIVSLPTR